MTGETHYQLPAQRTGADPGQLITFLRGAAGQPVTLDLSNVTFPDTPRLQVLVAAARHHHDTGISMKLTGVTPGFLDGMKLAGLSPDIFEIEEPQ